MRKIGQFYLLFCWTFVVFVALTMPGNSYGDVHVFTYYDKVVHIIMFGVFTFLLIKFLHGLISRNLNLVIIISALTSILYSYGGEYIQNFVPGREVSIYDFLAGVIGAILGGLFYRVMIGPAKPRLLLHICCIGCGVHVSQELRRQYDVTLYFYNPNIFPIEEFNKRLEEIKKVAKQFKFLIIVEPYAHDAWLRTVKGHEGDPEKGERCKLCYRNRLEQTARTAKKNKFDAFASTLTVSPHKNAAWISELGQELAREYGVNFFDQDFKKNDGFKKAAALSKELCLYRQDYCGCEFSIRAK